MLPESWHLLTMTMSILTTALLIAGIATPMWIWLDAGDDHVGVGLFYRVGFETDGVANPPTAFQGVKYDSHVTRDTTHWTVMTGLEVAATVLAFLSIPLSYVYYLRYLTKQDGPILYKIVFWNAILAFLCNASGIVVFIVYHGDALTEAPDISDESFPWSAVMSFAGGVVNFFIILIIHSKFRGDMFMGTAVPAGADPKMATYPSMKNAVMSRFFQSSPYPMDMQSIEDDLGPRQRNQLALPAPDIQDRQELIPTVTSRVPPPLQRFHPVPEDLGHRHSPIENNAQRFQPVPGDLERRHSPIENNTQRFQPVLRELVTRSNPRDRRNSYDATYMGNGGPKANGFVPYSSGLTTQDKPSIYVNAPTEVRKKLIKTTTILERNDQDGLVNTVEEELVYNPMQRKGVHPVASLAVPGTANGTNDSRRPGRDVIYNNSPRSSRGDVFQDNSRRSSGEFLVTAKHSLDRDVHRNGKYLVHTDKPSEVPAQGQRLVLNPSNFDENNVKYNPSFMYRPYSEQVY